MCEIELGVARMLERARIDGIDGRELEVPAELGGQIIETGPPSGQQRWLPPSGAQLYRLGHQHDSHYELLLVYYLLRRPGRLTYLELAVARQSSFGDIVEVVGRAQVPEHCLATLAPEEV